LLAGCVLEGLEEFLADGRVRIAVIEALSFCVPEIQNINEVVGWLTPLLEGGNEADSMAVLRFFDAVVGIYGAAAFRPESLRALIREDTSYRVKSWPFSQL
jgi:hypothetical protein